MLDVLHAYYEPELVGIIMGLLMPVIKACQSTFKHTYAGNVYYFKFCGLEIKNIFCAYPNSVKSNVENVKNVYKKFETNNIIQKLLLLM